jgi:hypothetical protein
MGSNNNGGIVGVRGLTNPQVGSSAVTSGNDNIRSLTWTLSPTSASTTVWSGFLSELTYSGTANVNAPGHPIALFGYNKINCPTYTVDLAIATEGKSLVTAGTVTSLVSVHAGLENVAVGATATNVSLMNAVVTQNQGTLSNLFLHDSGITAAASTIGNAFHYRARDITQAQATNSAAFYGLMSDKGGSVQHWNCYMTGSAPNAFAGKVRIGSTVLPVNTLDVTGNVAATTTILSSGATSGVGYATGAGGTITQATSKSTGVTLNKVCGTITMNAAALAAATSVSFTLTNSAIAATDVPLVAIKSGATAGAYTLTVDAVAAGTCQISLRNRTGGSLSEAVVINFALIKAVAA